MSTTNETNTDLPNGVSSSDQQQPLQLEITPIETKVKFYHNLNFIIFLICLYNVAQCMVATGQLMITVPLLEKIFGFQSYQMSFPNIFYNISFGICSFLLGYKRIKRKILAIGIGGIIVAVGCFLFITPHFISSYRHTTGKFENNTDYGIKQFHLCKPNGHDTAMKPRIDGPSIFDWDSNRANICLAIFCLSFSIIGLGSSTLHTYIITYLYEVTSDARAGIYLAVFYVCGAIGPAIGYILGKPFLLIHVTWPSKLENIEMTPKSENWIGAWWLGFFVDGVAILLCSVLIILVGLKSNRKKSDSMVSKSLALGKNEIELDNNCNTAASHHTENLCIQQNPGFFHKLSYLFKNVPLMLIFIGLSFDMLPLASFTTFLSKIIILQFRISMDNASLVSGAVIIPAACIGFIMGGLYNRFVVVEYNKILGLCIISYLTLFFIGGMFVSCPHRNVSGVTLNVGKVVTGIDYNGCNKNCNCDQFRYEPVCHGNITHFNPCVLGCTKFISNDKIVDFLNCKCKPNTVNQLTPVVDGGCVDKSCNNIYIYLAALAMVLILVLSLGIPFVLYNLSITGENYKDFTIGFFQTLVRFFVVFGPIVTGHLIDTSCILWLPDKYRNRKGNCAEYNNKDISLKIGSSVIATKLCASLCYTCAFILYLRKLRRS